MDKFIEQLNINNVNYDSKILEKFRVFKNELVDWNSKINLTSVEEHKIETKHFIDSLSLLPHIPKDVKNIIDIGSGAGFPGIPIAIMRQDIQVTLVDSIGKKTKFLEHIKNTLGLKNLHIENKRAEDLAHNSEFRERFDLVFARAVANLPILLEYTLPFLKAGGTFIAQKSDASEIDNSKNSLEILGGEIIKIEKIKIPDLPERVLIIIKKIKSTPKEFPRNTAILKKKPL